MDGRFQPSASAPIADLEARLYRIPPTVPWEDATHVVSTLEFVVVWLRLDNGDEGTGYAYTTGVGGSAVLALLTDYCRAMVVGTSAAPVALWEFLNCQLLRCGTGGINTLALGAVDMAAWDLISKRAQTPLHRLLGGGRDSIPAYGSGIDLHLDEPALLDEVRVFIDRGFAGVKIKVGRDDPKDDHSRVKGVRKVIGERPLSVDANQRWALPQAIDRLGQLSGLGLNWIEEPLHPEDFEGHAALRRATRVPVAAGESLYTRRQFLAYLRAGAIDVAQPDVSRVGGITEWLRIAALAAAYDVPVVPHYCPEISVALACAVENCAMIEWVAGGSFSEMGLLEQPIDITDGVARPFLDPGNGLSFDRTKLEAYRIDPAVPGPSLAPPAKEPDPARR